MVDSMSVMCGGQPPVLTAVNRGQHCVTVGVCLVMSHVLWSTTRAQNIHQITADYIKAEPASLFGLRATVWFVSSSNPTLPYLPARPPLPAAAIWLNSNPWRRYSQLKISCMRSPYPAPHPLSFKTWSGPTSLIGPDLGPVQQAPIPTSYGPVLHHYTSFTWFSPIPPYLPSVV